MHEDTVVQEVREAREAYARSFKFDIRAMVADLRRLDERGDWPVVRLAPRRAREAGTPAAAGARGDEGRA